MRIEAIATEITVAYDRVIFHGPISDTTFYRPLGCNVSDWEDFWNSVDKIEDYIDVTNGSADAIERLEGELSQQEEELDQLRKHCRKQVDTIRQLQAIEVKHWSK